MTTKSRILDAIANLKDWIASGVIRALASKMFTAYILKSETTNKYYIGSCESIDERLALHNAGRVRSTKSGLPWILVHKEQFHSRSEAWKREFQIKSWKSRAAIEKLVKTAQNSGV